MRTDTTYYGVLDRSPRKSIEKKIQNAASLYRERYNQQPNVCLVSDKATGYPEKVGDLTIRPDKDIPLDTFYLAFER